MSEARITLTLQGAEQVLQQLREMESRLSGLSGLAGGAAPAGAGGPMPGMVQAGGQVVATSGLPAAPGTPATAISSAAATAGTPQSAMALALATAPNQMGTLAMMGGALGGHVALSQMMSMMSQGAGGMGQAIAQGTPFQPVSLLGPGIGLGFTVAGAMVGSLFGPPGTLIGTGIGSSIGAMASSLISPIAEQAASNATMVDLARRMGIGVWDADYSASVSGRMRADMVSGRMLPNAQYVGAMSLPDDLRVPYLEGISGARFAPENIARIGLSGRMSVPDALRFMSYERPMETIAISEGLSWAGLSGEYGAPNIGAMREAAEAQARRAAEMRALGSAGRAASAAMAMMQLSGVDAVREQASVLSGLLLQSAGLRSAEAGHARSTGNYLTAADLEAQMAEEHAAALSARQSAADYELTDIRSRFALDRGAAQRDVVRSRRAGVRAERVPYASVAQVRAGESSALASYLARNRDLLTPAQQRALQDESEQLSLEAEEIEAQSERAVFSAREVRLGTRSARMVAAAAPTVAFGSIESAAETTGQTSSQILRERIALRQQELATARAMTDEVREQRRAEVATLQSQLTAVQASSAAAVVGARFQTAMVGIAERQAAGAIPFLRGVQGPGDIGERIGIAGEQVAAAQRALNDTLSAGFSRDSSEAQQARLALTSAQLGYEQTVAQSGVVGMTGAQRAEAARLNTQAAFLSSGYGGSAGRMREVIMRQLSLSEQLISAELANRAAGMAAGTWTDANEAAHQERIGGLAMHALSLQQQYDQGIEQRWMSVGYGMSGNASMVMSRFNNRTAAFAGIRNRVLGGDQETTREFRSLPARMMAGLLGMDNPAGFVDRTLSGGVQRVQIEVTVRDGQGRPLESTQKTLADAPTLDGMRNTSARRPSS